MQQYVQDKATLTAVGAVTSGSIGWLDILNQFLETGVLIVGLVSGILSVYFHIQRYRRGKDDESDNSNKRQ